MKEVTHLELRRLKGPDTKPWYLIDITLDERYLVSTGFEAQWGEAEFVTGLVKDIRVGRHVASLSFFNEGNKHTMPALLGEYHRKPLRIWHAPGNVDDIPLLLDHGYVEEGYFEEPDPIEPMLIFSGDMIVRAMGDYLQVVATRSSADFFPRLRIVPPLANWVAPRDSVINFNGTVIRLTPRL